jgi:hypothetical protein
LNFLQALAADQIGVMSQCMLMLLKFSYTDPEAAARAVAQPLVQLLGPALKHCLQQQQQQQQQQGANARDSIQALPSWTRQLELELTEVYLELLSNVLRQSKWRSFLGLGVHCYAQTHCVKGRVVSLNCVHAV